MKGGQRALGSELVRSVESLARNRDRHQAHGLVDHKAERPTLFRTSEHDVAVGSLDVPDVGGSVLPAGSEGADPFGLQIHLDELRDVEIEGGCLDAVAVLRARRHGTRLAEKTVLPGEIVGERCGG
jgi:hypothetical protein